jgi:hypothetical protein
VLIDVYFIAQKLNIADLKDDAILEINEHFKNTGESFSLTEATKIYQVLGSLKSSASSSFTMSRSVNLAKSSHPSRYNIRLNSFEMSPSLS